MVFIDKGDASSGVSHSTQYLSTFLELLEAIAGKLQTAPSVDRQRGVLDGAEQTLTPEEQALTDDACGYLAMSVLQQDGVERQTDEQGVRTVYAAEGYVISSQLNDPTGNSVYTVRSVTLDADVLQFQQCPSDPEKLVLFETESHMDDAMRLSFVKAFINEQRQALEQTEQYQGLQGIEKVAHQLSTYGELAPAGAKAIYVAHAVLHQQGPDTTVVNGERYTFVRSESGAVGIFERVDSQPCLVCSMDKDGTLKSTLSAQQQAIFSGLFAEVMSREKAQVSQTSSRNEEQEWLDGYGVPDLER